MQTFWLALEFGLPFLLPFFSFCLAWEGWHTYLFGIRIQRSWRLEHKLNLASHRQYVLFSCVLFFYVYLFFVQIPLQLRSVGFALMPCRQSGNFWHSCKDQSFLWERRGGKRPAFFFFFFPPFFGRETREN